MLINFSINNVYFEVSMATKCNEGFSGDQHGLMERVNGKRVKFSLSCNHSMKGYWGSRGVAPRILDLGTKWR
jgi:hypothetical protein